MKQPSLHYTSMSERSKWLESVMPYPIRWERQGLQGSTRCPFHNDRHPSFSVHLVDGWKCHAGCGGGGFEELARRVGSKSSPPSLPTHPFPVDKASSAVLKEKKHDVEYVYLDEYGIPVHLVGRDNSAHGKRFCIYHRNGDRWFRGKGCCPTIPYKLPQLLEATKQNQLIFVVEGEKDADTLDGKGVTATTNTFGAGKWSMTADFNDHFRGANVVILPDNDPPGEKHAEQVKDALRSVVNSIQIVRLPGLPLKGDVTDWFNAGHTLEELLKIVQRSNSTVEDKINVNVRSRYFDGHQFVPRLLAIDVLAENPIITVNGVIFAYSNGVYRPNGEATVRQLCLDRLHNEFRSNRVDQVIDYVRTCTAKEPHQVNVDDGLLNVQNGLLNVQFGELHPHSAERYSTIQLPVKYVPQAACPRIEHFFNEVLPEDTVPTVLEFLGYCLTKTTKYEKALMLTGTGANGKSTFIRLTVAFLGNSNTVSIPLQELSESRWKRADLQRALLNSFADIPRKTMESSSLFKAIVSGDEIDAERKGRDPFYFRPFAKLLFSANELPSTKDVSKAFFRRWIIVPFNNTFEYGRNANPDLLKQLIEPDELSGLLNLALVGLDRLTRNGSFTNSDSISKTMDVYRKEADSVIGFLSEACEFNPLERCSCQLLYATYRNWCEQVGINPIGKITFNKRLMEVKKLEKGRLLGQQEHWIGVRLA